METPLFVGIPSRVPMVLVPEVLKWKLNFQRTEIVAVMGEEFYRCHVGGEMYQATYILYQFLGVHPGTIHALNEIAAHPPAEVGVHNGNEVIMHKYGLDYFIQIQHDGDDHGQDDGIKYTPPGN